MSNRFIALIPCAGSGSRFGGTIPKQYTLLGNKSVLEHTIQAFLNVSLIDQIVIVANPLDDYIDRYSKISPKIMVYKIGGSTRAESVKNGLKQLVCNPSDWVLVHDAARCCITPELIAQMIHQLKADEVGGILAIPATDTIKTGQNGIIGKTLDRSKIFLAQTPQMFRYSILSSALNSATLDSVTDEASSVEQLGLAVRLVSGDSTNIKLTYASDMRIAKMFLKV